MSVFCLNQCLFWILGFFFGENISALTVFYTLSGVSKVGYHCISFSVQNQSELCKRCKALHFTVTMLVVVGWGVGGIGPPVTNLPVKFCVTFALNMVNICWSFESIKYSFVCTLFSLNFTNIKFRGFRDLGKIAKYGVIHELLSDI